MPTETQTKTELPKLLFSDHPDWRKLQDVYGFTHEDVVQLEKKIMEEFAALQETRKDAPPKTA